MEQFRFDNLLNKKTKSKSQTTDKQYTYIQLNDLLNFTSDISCHVTDENSQMIKPTQMKNNSVYKIRQRLSGYSYLL